MTLHHATHRSSVRLLLADAGVRRRQPPIRLDAGRGDVTRGLETSHRLAEARAREEGAQAQRSTPPDLARQADVSASAGYTRTNHVTSSAFPQPTARRLVIYPDIPDNYLSRLSFQWPIYTVGPIDALERAAMAEAQAAGADIETARADLRLEVVRAYWAAVTASEAVRVLEESIARAEAQLRDARSGSTSA